MNSENSRIAKNTIYLYLRTIVVLLISLYTSRVVLQSLGIDDFGIYNVVGGLVAMFSFINGAMAAATLRFLTYELGKNNNQRLKIVFCTSIIIHLVISFIVIVLGETVGLWFLYNKMIIPPDRMFAATIVYQISILTAVISIMNVPYNSLLIAHERMSSFAYISILDATLRLLTAISISIYIYDRLILYSILIFGAYAIVIFIYWIYCRRSFPESHFQFIKDQALITKMSKFASWNLFSNLAFVTYTQGLNILLNVFYGPAVNAARGIAVQVQQAVVRFVDSFQSALNPQITKSYACNDRERLLFLIDTSSRYSFYLLLMLIFPLIASIDYILSIWLGVVPDHTSNFVRLTLLIEPISVMMNPLNIATQATGHIKRFFFITGTLQLIILPLAYIALIMGGPPEAVYIVYFAHVFLSSFVYMYVTCAEIQLSMSFFFKTVVIKLYLILLIAAIIPLLFDIYLPQTNSLWIALIKMLVAELSVLFSVILLGTKQTERITIISILKKKLSI